MYDDIYQMYLEELAQITPCSDQEEAALLIRVQAGDDEAKARLAEGSLPCAVELAKSYEGQGLPLGDLVQEANLALVMAVDSYRDGDFKSQMRTRVTEAIEAALQEQKQEENVEEEMLARVNVLKDISRDMAEELGREATVEELAARMKMTEDEIRDIMKLTLDAMSVNPDAEI